METSHCPAPISCTVADWRDTLALYREMGGEKVTVGSDAHRPEDVGCFIRQRQELLRECGFRYFTTFTGGEPEFKEL